MNAFLTIDEQQVERDRAEIVVQNQELIAKAGDLVIADAEQASAAAAYLADIKGRIKALEARRVESKKPALEMGKIVDDLFKELKAPLEEIVEKVNGGLLEFRKAEQKRIAEANEAAERERQAEIDAQEAKRKAEEDAAREKREKAEAEAAAAREARAAGDHSAEATVEQAEQAAKTAEMEERIAQEQRPVITQNAAPIEQAKSIRGGGANVSFRTVWKFEVTKPEHVPIGYLTVNEKAISAAVKDGEREIPGVRIWSEEVPSVRAA